MPDIAEHPKPRVPVEVAENVIDLLADDQHVESSIRNCALVCQAWLPRSRAHLFHTVHIVDLKRLRSLKHVLLASPVLSHLVQSLDLEGIPLEEYWSFEGANHWITSDVFNSAPLVLLPLLPNLCSWSFRGKTTNVYSLFEMRTVLLTGLPRHSAIINLSLVDIHVERMSDLVRLLLALPSLRSLHINTVTFSKHGTYLDRLLDRLSAQLRLSALQICSEPSRSFLHVLERAVAFHVSHLTVDMYGLSTTEGYRLHKEPHKAIPPKSLASYCSLVKLTLTVWDGSPGDPFIDIDYVRHIIEVALPPTVSTLNIDLTHFSSLSRALSDPESSTTKLHWQRLDQVLTVARDLHPRLRNIGVILPRTSQKHTDRWTLAIKALLPKSIARSICDIVSNVDYVTSRCTYQHRIMGESLNMLAADPTGTLIVSFSPDSIYFWELEFETLHHKMFMPGDPHGLVPVYASQHAPYIIITPFEKNVLIVLDQYTSTYYHNSPDDSKYLTHVFCGSPFTVISISTDGRVRAVSMDSRVLVVSMDSRVRAVSMDTIRGRSPDIIPSVPAHVHPASSRLRAGSFAVSADERWLADWHTPGMVLVWNVVPKAPTLHSQFTFPSFSAHTSEKPGLEPEFLLTATFDRPEETSHSLCHLVGVSNRGAIWRWDVEKGAPVHCPWKLPYASELSSGTSSIAFSRSGLRLAWICPDQGSSRSSRGSSTVRVIDLSGSRPTGGRRARSVELEGHDGAVNAFALNPRGDYIATASADGTVRLWRTEDGECIRAFTEHEAAVTHVVISADGRILASGAENGTVCVKKMAEILSNTEENEG